MTWTIVPLRLTFYRSRFTWLPFIFLGSVFIISLALARRTTIYLNNCRKAEDLIEQMDHRRFLNMTWSSKNASIPLLTLFTTWDSSMNKQVVYSNTIKNWHSLGSDVKTVVFTNNSSVAETARSGGWGVKDMKYTACSGTPILRAMFSEAMTIPVKSKLYGYANADLLFNSGFKKSLKAIVENEKFDQGPILIVGKRIEVNISNLNEPLINRINDVDELAKHGNLYYGFAADFFVTNDLFPWHLVPDIVVGRPLVDNWLIWFAREIGAKVIDISGTVSVVHQKTNGLKRVKTLCNKAELLRTNLLPTLPLFRGMIECARYVTKYTNERDIIVLQKVYLQHSCKASEAKFRWAHGMTGRDNPPV